jgi:hypothetical protein
LEGGRIGDILEALGEAVCCIEYELKNHGCLDDCAAFLEVVAPLRAMLAALIRLT